MTKEPLDNLKALDLVESCKENSYLYMLAMGWSVVTFCHVQAQINHYLSWYVVSCLVKNREEEGDER